MTVTEMAISYIRFNPNPVAVSGPSLASVQVTETALTWGDVAELTWGEMQSRTW